MKKIFLLAATFFVSFTATNPVNDIKPLYRLTGGIWKMKTAKGFICESWKKINPDELSGISYKIAGKDTAITERVQLVKKDGQIFYTPTVTGENNGQPIPFKLSRVGKNTYLFSNPGHDYPQVVAYRFITKDSLNAWIEGSYRGKPKRIDFHYKRMAN